MLFGVRFYAVHIYPALLFLYWKHMYHILNTSTICIRYTYSNKDQRLGWIKDKAFSNIGNASLSNFISTTQRRDSIKSYHNSCFQTNIRSSGGVRSNYYFATLLFALTITILSWKEIRTKGWQQRKSTKKNVSLPKRKF